MTDETSADTAPAGKAKDRYGNPRTIKLTGKVEPYFKDNVE